MNHICLIGRLTADPEVRYAQGDNPMAVARYTLAVDRPKKAEGQQVADFIRCVAFGKTGEFAEKYLHKGNKIALEGRIQTGSYDDKDGKKVYTTDVIVNHHYFCESAGAAQPKSITTDENGFMTIPDGLEDDGLPFN